METLEKDGIFSTNLFEYLYQDIINKLLSLISCCKIIISARNDIAGGFSHNNEPKTEKVFSPRYLILLLQIFSGDP